MNHNWSARKQRLNLQSAAGISRHSASSEDRIRQCGTSSELAAGLPLWLNQLSHVCARIGRTIPSGVRFLGWDADINSGAYAMRLIS